jgi:hypothetical protein
MTPEAPVSINAQYPDVAVGTDGVCALITALKADVIDLYAVMERHG